MPVGPNTRWIGGSVRIESGQTYNQKPIDVVKSDLELVPFPSSEPTSDRPTLKWKAYPGADSYRVFVSPLGSDDFSRNVFQQVTEPQFTVTSPLAPGEYHWHVTAYHGRASIANLGLNSGRFCVGERLIRLAAEGDVGGVKSLLAAGADPNIVEKCSDVVSGWTALMAAARNGSAAVATELIRAHADVNARTHFGGSGATALDVAVAHGHAEVASVIKAAGGTGK
jgi:ankyrin repeat protein